MCRHWGPLVIRDRACSTASRHQFSIEFFSLRVSRHGLITPYPRFASSLVKQFVLRIFARYYNFKLNGYILRCAVNFFRIWKMKKILFWFRYTCIYSVTCILKYSNIYEFWNVRNEEEFFRNFLDFEKCGMESTNKVFIIRVSTSCKPRKLTRITHS